MDLIEIAEGALTAEERPHPARLARTLLAKHDDVEFERRGLRFKVHVADEVDFDLGIEIDDDEQGARDELMMSWTNVSLHACRARSAHGVAEDTTPSRTGRGRLAADIADPRAVIHLVLAADARALAAVSRNCGPRRPHFVRRALVLTGTLFYWRLEPWTKSSRALYFCIDNTSTTISYQDLNLAGTPGTS